MSSALVAKPSVAATLAINPPGVPLHATAAFVCSATLGAEAQALPLLPNWTCTRRALGGDQKSCCIGANVSFSKGDVVEVSWSKANKRRKYAATMLAVDHSKGTRPSF